VQGCAAYGVLLRHPGILEAAVVRRPDARWGEVPVAFVISADSGLADTELLALCRRDLVTYKHPKDFVFPVGKTCCNDTGKSREPNWRPKRRNLAGGKRSAMSARQATSLTAGSRNTSSEIWVRAMTMFDTAAKPPMTTSIGSSTPTTSGSRASTSQTS